MRLCGSVAILTAHKFQSHFPTFSLSHVCLQPYAPCALRSAHLPIFPTSFFPAFPPGRRPGPYGFRLVDRAYSSERPEADFPRLPSALCPMPHALCALLTFPHLPIFSTSFFPAFRTSPHLHQIWFKNHIWCFFMLSFLTPNPINNINI